MDSPAQGFVDTSRIVKLGNVQREECLLSFNSKHRGVHIHVIPGEESTSRIVFGPLGETLDIHSMSQTFEFILIASIF